ncbi:MULTISPECIES: hypothetical protein [Prochlorococcus]|uniref:Uncharacterized protein n=1 Tax=Prochlorococcus marinus (strain SARG / CCMP1375 / SS120) TaxID=167539 RepID=Q7VBU3_PROMA|nr:MULTISPECIES: hypothetical protein [Prochlorococcus]AAQ00044.1 Uncharacterized protein Pro_0999 [Prochlorococcus marinus subsp. marinus str. CCMP1375]KGG13841.1 hypothetical protein EV04_0326 [Prochlorococcus marinus str. LG]KGG18975.1 hypothetical protein EV08_1462 [Prochlorococcus marinus str. SS2]KGG23486.1 hypothetical protein EV09_1110 [Prochlorococcus marinus str. SS35]KGG32278.1 hypothetical protein EV10_1393 [Prochlorococcus marinus str. SS51]
MQINSELCHVDDEKIIVRITALENQIQLGSALGQGSNVHEAEESAIQQLLTRLKEYQKIQSSINSNEAEKSLSVQNSYTKEIEFRKSTKEDSKSIKSDNYLDIVDDKKVPNDWSEEISKIDIEIERLGWNKEDENEFMKITIGQSNRNRIKSYEDILFFIELLQKMKKGEDMKNININYLKEKLISESNDILRSLNWSNETAREYFVDKFKVNSRSELGIYELLKFVSMLGKELKS